MFAGCGVNVTMEGRRHLLLALDHLSPSTGLLGKWTYFLHTIPNVSDLLEPLEATITGEFIPAIIGRSVGELERKLFSCLGCLAI